MMGLLGQPGRALWIGVALAAAALGLWLISGPSDTLGLISFIARLVHVGGAILWLGMVWFVNFIQLAALREADDAGRAALMKLIVPRVARLFRIASHVVVASGIVLLLTTGYMLDRWVFPSAVYIPSARGAMLWGGVVAGLAMWALVHAVIWPSLRIVLDSGAAPGAVALARERILIGARLNLVLSVPVTLAMVAASHFY